MTTLSQGLLPFKVEGTCPNNITSFSGAPLLLEALRSVVPNRTYRTLRRALDLRSWRVVRRHLETVLALRFHLLNVAATVATSGRRILLRLASTAAAVEIYIAARLAILEMYRKLRAPASTTA
jgi:hypothetical protein